MELETMRPNPAWDAASYPEVVAAFGALGPGDAVRVWGADWCGDCRTQLPDFAAALSAADLPEECLECYPVDREKDGELVDAYDVAYIPTIVVEVDGEEVARFVESADAPPAVHLAEQLAERVPDAG